MIFFPKLRGLLLHKICLSLALGVFLPWSSFAGDEAIGSRVEAELARALPRMACNLSPRKEKTALVRIDGQETKVQIKPAAGSVSASPNTDNPDYYFHWNRDSALTVRSLLALLPKVEGQPAADSIRAFLADFVRFSEKLQASETPYGLGEVRFNLDGSVDESPWSRPQHDGPALRALAMMDLLALGDAAGDGETRRVALLVLKADLDHLSYAFEAKSYDLWEISFGHHFFTRLVQLYALERGAREWPRLARREWSKAAVSLRKDLASHWSEADGFYHFSAGKVSNWEGDEVREVGGGRDASAILAVNSAGFTFGEFSLTDPRALASAASVEEYFRGAYPWNRDHQRAPAIGRHPGDDYYGGNPWFVLTSAYAELYYRLSHELREGDRPFAVTRDNRAFLGLALGRQLFLGQDIRRDGALAQELAQALRDKGDGFMATMLDAVGSDGAMAEQFSKEDAKPISADDLTWSYSAFLSAALARGDLRMDGLKLDCAQ